METEKPYKCYCHVCNCIFELKAVFLHCPYVIEINGESYPVQQCGKHTGAEVRKAFAKMTGCIK